MSLRCEIFITVRSACHSVRKTRRIEWLRHVDIVTRVERAGAIVVARVSSKGDRVCPCTAVRLHRAHLSHKLQSIHMRHAYVRHDYVGPRAWAAFQERAKRF